MRGSDGGARAGLPVIFWPGALGLAALTVWVAMLVLDVAGLRASVEAHVVALQDIRSAADAAQLQAMQPDPAAWPAIDAALADAEHRLRAHGPDSEVGRGLVAMQVAVDELRGAVRGGGETTAAAERIVQAQAALIRAVRGETARLSARLGARWTALYVLATAVIALAGAVLALLVVAHRRRAEAELHRARVVDHLRVVEQAAARVASGDIETPIGDATEFERSLERIRGDLAGSIRELDARNKSIEQLNAELRHQIAERSRALEAALARLHGRPAGLTPGDTFADRYAVGEALGAGGHGFVHRATRTSDGREVALKILRRVDDDVAVSRFLREAQVLAGLRHDNIVDVLDVGISSDGQLYLVTELLGGASLKDARERYGDAAWARPLLADVARGLAFVHDHGVVHRDVKPGNIVLAGEPAPRAVLIDFGIARLAGRAISDDDSPPAPAADTGTTRAAASPRRDRALVGTPRYLAPELRDDPEGGPAADVFAFGVTAYRVLTDSYPFPRPAPSLIKTFGELPPPVPLARRCSALGDAAAVLDRCLRAEPGERPTAAELADALTPRASAASGRGPGPT